MGLEDRSDLLERLAGLKTQKGMPHYPEEKDAALAALTGINSSKLGYYRELKAKVHELEASNEQLREAKRVADDLYEQVRRNAEELSSLYERSLLQAKRLDRAIASLKSISQVLTTTTRGVEVLLQSVVRTAAELFDTEYAVMTVGVPGGAEQAAYCAYGLPSSAFPAIAPRRLLDLIDVAARERRPVTDPPGEHGDWPVTLCVPMFRDDLLVGNLCLQFREGRNIAESDLSILQTLASQAAVAVENARLFEESQRLQLSTRQLYEMAQEQKDRAEKRTQELTLARDELTLMQQEQLLNEERNRIARELHDSVAQILISIGLNLEWCRQQVGEESPAHEKLLSL
ncbi:MAG TPA: GAF domain-containing protein, partial [Chloroflexota bacterium]|nr:GAF domain-containing protein [Chloroflexota bacterium]